MLGKKRALQEESQKLKLKCFEVSNDLQARKRKYEMVMGQMWKGNADQSDKEAESSSEGGSRSEAYFIIKLAQEREHYRQYVFNMKTETNVTGKNNVLCLHTYCL